MLSRGTMTPFPEGAFARGGPHHLDQIDQHVTGWSIVGNKNPRPSYNSTDLIGQDDFLPVYLRSN
jgi:hypothetical protein